MKFIIEKNYINGEWIGAKDGAAMTVHDPKDNGIIGHVPDSDAAQVETAVQAAHAAQGAWAATTAYERSGLLRKLFDLMVSHKEELAEVMHRENGKSMAEARAEMDYAASFIEWFAEEAKRSYGRMIPASQKDRTIHVIRQPVGVCGIITPWNFPSAMLTRKIGAAFAAGCTVVVKPDHRTPYSALALAKLAEQAGFPKGVFNIVTGDAAMIGKILTTHEYVRKISFTGSTKVGKILTEQAASTLKRLSMELGGNAPFIVCEDADIDAAVDGIMIAKLRNMGQSCVAANRIFVHEKIYDAFLEKLVLRVTKAEAFTLIERPAAEKIHQLVEDAVQCGATLVLGGVMPPQGAVYPPTILRDVPINAQCEQTEIFGPVFAISKFADDTQALQRANNTNVGLASYVYTQGTKRLDFYMMGLEYGMVGVNTGLVSFTGAPFGGFKDSGFHREGGTEGLEAYQEIKYIAVQN